MLRAVKHIILSVAILLMATDFCAAQNALFIPPVLSGTTFNLNVQNGTTEFWPGVNTPTFGINGNILAPTLILQKGDWVTMNVTNNLTGTGNSTTMHWHGLHVPAMADGGPHQIIAQGSTWSPQFEVMNDAATFWYHPHGEGKTDRHVSKGVAGMIIVKDSAEAALNLPRTYGVDDFPLVVQTKAFDILNQIAVSTFMDTLPMVNATVNAYLNAPAQVVRLRLLNGASDRSFLFGFSNNMNFTLIGNDGGLLDSAITLNRIRLSNGERAEILVNLSALQGDTIQLMNYGSELPNGIIGSAQVGNGMAQLLDYDQNALNGADFALLQMNIGAPTGNAITTVPTTLVPNIRWQQSPTTVLRTFTLAPEQMNMQTMIEGPFTINGDKFSMDTVNVTCHLNDIEAWTINNQTQVAHPIHIHDVQFYITDVNGSLPQPYQSGKKDVVLVMPMQTVSFITKFEDFADDMTPYMYHCHLLHHEDDGMMGSFLVIDTNTTALAPITSEEGRLRVFPNPSTDVLNITLPSTEKTSVGIFNSLGEEVYAKSGAANGEVRIANWPSGLYTVQVKTQHQFLTQKFIKH